MGLKAFPYLYYERWPVIEGHDSQPISGLWIDDWNELHKTLDIEDLVDSYPVDLLIIAGVNLELPREYFMKLRFTDSACVDSVDRVSICVASRLPISTRRILNFGVNSFPGGVFTIVLEGGQELQLGVMSLERSLSKESFERNRVTARRLSSIMRDSNQLRIVAAKFNTSPFSQLVSVYSEQAKMNSLMFGQGLWGTLAMNLKSKVPADSNIFVSKDFVASSLKSIAIKGQAQRIIRFEILRK